MVTGSMSVEIESPVEAKRLWNALVKDGDDFIPKQAPEIFASITILEGDGGVGTVKQINFTPGNKDFSYVKERVEEVDEASFEYGFSHVEGAELGKRLGSAKFRLKFTPKAGGGCVHTWTCDYETLPGVPEEEGRAEQNKANVAALFKKMEAYLLANPTLYC